MITSDILVDAAMKDAATAIALSHSESLGEKKHLEPAVKSAFQEASFDASSVKVGYQVVDLPDWAPIPGGVDLATFDRHGSLEIGIELKVNKVDEALWDILKMASLTLVPNVSAAYVAVAATQGKWTGKSNCVALFSSPLHESKEWQTAFFFDAYKKAWCDLLLGGSGRPTRVPQTLTLTVITAIEIPAAPNYELRVVRVEDPHSGGWIIIGEEGWPVRKDPPLPPEYPRQIADSDLTLDDLPAPDAREDAYHTFALSMSGYERTGSFADCAELANTALEQWLSSGSLPQTLRDLRCALFFEQRRWHHYGEGFDEQAFVYVKALVSAIRVHVMPHV